MYSFSYKLLRAIDNTNLEFRDSVGPNKEGSRKGEGKEGIGNKKTHVHVGF